MAAGRLKIDIRRKRILELLAQNGQVTVAELSGLLNATQTTIRTDLDTMAAENRLVRIPGGAIAIPAQPVQTPVQEAAPDALAAQKRAIAAKVLSHIQDGDTLFLNSGSTTLRVAEALCARKRLCVVTNSIRAAEVLAGYPETHVVLLGGEINAIYGFTFGDDAVQQLGRYQPAWAILSVDGVNAVQGITTYHAEEAMVNRIMIQQAHRAIIAADRRKVGRGQSFHHIPQALVFLGIVQICQHGLEGIDRNFRHKKAASFFTRRQRTLSFPGKANTPCVLTHSRAVLRHAKRLPSGSLIGDINCRCFQQVP